MKDREEKIKPTEKLDAVLTWLFDNKDNLDCFYGYGLTRTYSKPKEMTLTRREVTNILNKLYADGYLNLKMQGTESVSQNVDVAHYSINFNGEVFLQKGGYTKEFSNRKLELKKTKQDLKTSQRNDRIIKNASIFAVILSTLVLLFELYKFFCSTCHAS
ncbi:MAG: hypothetical protein P8K68_00225 [Algibacter sp.]|uniref:hypothetical protein n=1 Tax=Algibacter sp. TaxID=1872428 RepID=UPI002606458F|nr:hypothetical protein [Algibacter sp.]MDG1728961.1 hypothetical protein [Algibacter sp.]MDG2177199.1 hypothetical protein [Algibacter sp.]